MQGVDIEREVYVCPPPECTMVQCGVSKKLLMGYVMRACVVFRLGFVLLGLRLSMSHLDNAVFLYYEGGDLAGVVCIRVDDILWTGTQTFEQHLIKIYVRLRGKKCV